MPRARRALWAGALVCALPATALPAAPATAGPEARASRAEARLVAAVNDYRAERGLKRLRRSGRLSSSADRFARHILRSDRLHHHRRIWGSSGFRWIGENLAWTPGRGTDPRRVVALWAGSASHRRVLESRRLRWIGAGREYGRLGRSRGSVWVLHVGGR